MRRWGTLVYKPIVFVLLHIMLIAQPQYTTKEELYQRKAIYPGVLLILIYASLGKFSKQTTCTRPTPNYAHCSTSFTDAIRKLKCNAIKRRWFSYGNINDKSSILRLAFCQTDEEQLIELNMLDMHGSAMTRFHLIIIHAQEFNSLHEKCGPYSRWRRRLHKEKKFKYNTRAAKTIGSARRVQKCSTHK